MAVIRHEEWRDQNLERLFPLQDGLSPISNTGMQIPNSAFLDASLYILSGKGPYYLSRITVTPTSLSFGVAGKLQEELVSGTILHSDPGDVVVLADVYGRPAGVLVLGLGRNILKTWDNAVHSFALGAAPFATEVQADFSENGIEGILAGDAIVTGRIWLVGERGVQLWVQDGFIRVDIVGNPFKELEECFEANDETADELAHRVPVVTINGIPADIYGDFQLFAGGQLAENQILRVNPIEGGLRISGAKT